MNYGEEVDAALRREVAEELGVTDYIPKEVGRYVFEGLRERELVYVFETVYDGEVRPAAEELAGGAFFSPSAIKERIGTGFFTPNFEEEYMKYYGDR